MSSPEQFGDHRRVFIAVVPWLDSKKPNKRHSCSHIHKSCASEDIHGKRLRGRLAAMGATRICVLIPWPSIQKRLVLTEIWQSSRRNRFRPIRSLISNRAVITFCGIEFIARKHTPFIRINGHWIVHRIVCR